MKEWMTPDVDELSVSATEYGQNFSTNFDEVRVDQNGKYWYSFASGVVNVNPDGEVEKID